MKILLLAVFLILLNSSCALFPDRATAKQLRDIDARPFGDLSYLGTSRGRHYFRNGVVDPNIYYWIPVSELALPSVIRLNRFGKGIPAHLSPKKSSTLHVHFDTLNVDGDVKHNVDWKLKLRSETGRSHE